MRILQVIPSIAAGFGGPSQAILGLSAALARLGHDVTIFTTNADTSGFLDVPLEVPVKKDGFIIKYFPVRFLKHYKFSHRLAGALRNSIPDFDLVDIHSLFQFSTLAASFYCRKYHKPYLIRPIGHLDPYSFRHRFIVKKIYFELFERFNLNGADAIHFTTKDEMRLASSLRLKAKPVVIRLGIDTRDFNPLPAYGLFRGKYPQLKDKKILLFFSRINFKKGLDILVNAFKIINRQRKDVYLAIVGPDDGYKDIVVRWLQDAQLLDRTVFTGMLTGAEKLAALRDSDIFVLPSYSENFGIVVVEAMASGLPVVISDHVGLHAMISEAGAGIVVGLSAQALAEALAHLLNNPVACQEMAAKAKALVAEKFEWDTIAKSMSAVYEDILRQSLHPAGRT